MASVVTTVAGLVKQSGSAVGQGSAARFMHPRISFINPDDTIYVLDNRLCAIYLMTLDGVVTHFAGGRRVAEPEDGPLLTATFQGPLAIAQGPDGTLYVADGDLIRTIRDGQVKTLAGHQLSMGDDNYYEHVDGVGAAAHMTGVDDIWIGVDGRIFLWDEDILCTVTPEGSVTAIGRAWSRETQGFDRQPNQAKGPDGLIYYSSEWAGRDVPPGASIAREDPAGNIVALGQGGTNPVDGPIEDARFAGSTSFAFHVPSNTLYFTDGFAVRKLTNPDTASIVPGISAATTASIRAMAAVSARSNLDSLMEAAVVPLPVLAEVADTYTAATEVFDVYEAGEVKLDELKAMTGEEEKILFKFNSSYSSTNVVEMNKAIADRSSVFYECKRELMGAPRPGDIFIDNPYFRLQLNGNFMVSLQELKAALAGPERVFLLELAEKKLPFVASHGSVLDMGHDVNIVSADHCQSGTEQNTYSLKILKLTKTGGRRRRKTYRKGRGRKMKKMTRKRRSTSS